MLLNLNMGKFLFLISFVNSFYSCSNKKTSEAETIINDDGDVNFIPALAGAKSDDDVPYLNQRANDKKPDATCCLTSAAMILSNTLIAAGRDLSSIEGKMDPDVLFSRYGERNVCSGLRMWQCSPGLRNLLHEEIGRWHKKGTVSCETSQGTENDIQYMISKKIPLIYHGKFTQFGHCITIIGYSFKNTDRNNWTLKVHDPYGKWLGSTGKYDKNLKSESSEKGNFQTYNYLKVKNVSSIGSNMRFEFVAFSDQLKGIDLKKWNCRVRNGDSPDIVDNVSVVDSNQCDKNGFAECKKINKESICLAKFNCKDDFSPIVSETRKTCKVVSYDGFANFRTGPSTNDKIMKAYKNGDVVTLNYKTGNWSNVEVDNSEGYIYTSLLNCSK